MNRKDRYRDLYTSQVDAIPVFHSPWWLDTVCGADNWDVCLVEDEQGISGYLPYYKSARFFSQWLIMPPLTAYLGPNLPGKQQSGKNRLNQEKKVYTELIRQLPRYGFFNQSFSPAVQNWLPFYWGGFRQTTRYTYCIPSGQSPDDVWENFEGRVRNDIRKARDKFSLEAVESVDIDTFYSINEKVYSRKGRKIPYSLPFLQNLDAECIRNDARTMLFANDTNGQIHAAVYIVRDRKCSYYLMGGNHPALQESGGNTLLLWEAIRRSLADNRDFDFEGSMLPGIEKHYRGFNAVQTPYFRVYRARPLLLRLLIAMRHGY